MAVDLAEAAGRAGAPRVVAVGGDGTIHEVAEGLLRLPKGERPVLGVVPCGTANDFAAQFDLPMDAPAGWLRAALDGEPRPLDIGFAGARPFVNLATIGAPAEISAETNLELKAAVGKVAYTATAIASAGSIGPANLTVRGPDVAFQGEVVAMAIGNGHQAGGGFVLFPDARLEDGLLDVLIVPRMGLPALGIVAGGAFLGGIDLSGRVERYRVASLEVTAPEPFALSLDGEVGWEREVRFGIEPHALWIAAPPERVYAQAG
jgi:YegS/Rv2252/BmrU family lipid kinase